MKRVYGVTIAGFTAVCVLITSAWAVGDKLQPFMASDPPPYPSRVSVAQLQGNVQSLTQQVQKLADTVQSSQVTQLMEQRRTAQSAIDDAAQKHRHDPIAEKMRDDANIKLMQVLKIPAPPP